MFEVKIKIDGLDLLTEAIALVGSAIAHHNGMENTEKALQNIGSANITEPKTEVAQPVVPTTTKSYTLDELSKAAIGLMDAGKQQDLLFLLNNDFKVASLPELPQESYGQFAIKLRELGADI
ncbi:MAG: hypothetical protein Q4P25_04110 [Tissierellia bacterium]|nr:hypothetical protein [Tissierellia bacterium]